MSDAFIDSLALYPLSNFLKMSLLSIDMPKSKTAMTGALQFAFMQVLENMHGLIHKSTLLTRKKCKSLQMFFRVIQQPQA